MAPALLIDFGFETGRRPRCGPDICTVAGRAGRAGAAAATGARAFPKLVKVIFTDPAAVLAMSAGRSHTRRIGSDSWDEVLKVRRHIAPVKVAAPS
jgi:hypothetical protein